MSRKRKQINYSPDELFAILESQVIINTDPAIRLSTKFAGSSLLLKMLVKDYLSSGDIKDFCILELDSDGIPAETWVLADYLLRGITVEQRPYMESLDDIMFIFEKYGINIDILIRADKRIIFDFAVVKYLLQGAIFKRVHSENHMYYTYILTMLGVAMKTALPFQIQTLRANLAKSNWIFVRDLLVLDV
jgi:hypothetical protein